MTLLCVICHNNNLDILGGVYHIRQEEMLGGRSACAF
jgi:hypothetical protein